MQKQKNKWPKFLSAGSSAFILAVASAQTAFGQGQGWNKSNYDMTGLPKTTLLAIITNITSWLLMIIGFVAIIGFIISGILYLTATGDEDQQERAKRAMYYSITGVIVGLAGLVVIYAVGNLLSGQTL
ncbi:MAG: pilin [Candidatus Moranbacteria bacterium]|nr:pilin [Candidatus Moranbacteria bacterium]